MTDTGTRDQEPPEPPDSGAAPAGALSERDQRIIVFERQWWKFEGSKEQAIRDEFGFSPTRYYQLLNELIERPEALVFDPMTVKRIRRLRADRRRQRTARKLGIRL